MTVNLRALVDKLTPQARAVLEAAAGFCMSRTHYDVEIEHFLYKALVADSDVDIGIICDHYSVERARLQYDLEQAIDRLKSGNARTPALSPHLVRMLSEAWSLTSLEFGAPTIRTGFALLALVASADLVAILEGISTEFIKIPADGLRKDLIAITASRSAEASVPSKPLPSSGTDGAVSEPITQTTFDGRSHEVFISYASPDQHPAFAICRGLEADGIACWIAPRDVPAGQPYDECIVEAIEHSKLVVLVFSKHANDSRYVADEISVARQGGLTILPVRLEMVPLSKAFKFQIGRAHWLDAVPPIDQHIPALSRSVANVLRRRSTANSK
jgi:hypothetical protein